jgi:maltooligosyltrehalose trehalohydrolase
MRDTTLPLGARYRRGTTSFHVWAPEHHSVDLVVGEHDIRPLRRDACGYWSGTFDDLPPGALYRYRLGGDDEKRFPDPASRFQPSGVHGPSQVVDPDAFAWTDGDWRAPSLADLVFYELHVGTFTPAGTFRAVIERLPYLKELGVSAIELMPVGDFAGDRNWGYDGVALFAPARCYGTPDDLRAVVDAAHAHGLAVFLDVVYNHFGPDGAYATAFSPHYFTDRHRSPWGNGVNLDGPRSRDVRRFFIENALHWVREYHVDGLRLDATHALQDESPVHFLAELTDTVRDRSGRPVVFVAEDHRNLAQLLLPRSAGGWGVDGVWADDFHHQARVHTAHDREGYYADFAGTAADIAATIRQGWYFTGQHSKHQGHARGTDPSMLSPEQFVLCIQNHDQIGNRADGARLNHHVDAATFRALSVLLLLAPETPLLFMGQEWAASTPFQFFTNFDAELGRQVTEGRRKEFSAFAAFADPAARAAIPDPQAVETFTRSKLAWEELQHDAHAVMHRLYRKLLALRPTARDASDAAQALDGQTVMLRRGALTVVVRLSGAGAVVIPQAASTWRDMPLTTEDADVAVDPLPIRVDSAGPFTVHFPRPGAAVFAGLRFAP